MAKRMNALKRAPKIARQTALSNRAPRLSVGTSYLAQLHAQRLKAAERQPRQQLTIQIRGQPMVPRPVKIIHADSN
jgi:hypothetical protein